MRRILRKLPFFHHQPPISLPYRSVVIMSTKRPVNLEKMVEKILIYSNDNIHQNIEQLNFAVDYLRERRLQRRDASNFAVAAFRAVCEMDKEIGVEFGYSIFEKNPDERGLRSLISHLWSLDRPEEALEVLKKLGSSDWKREKLEKLIHWISRKSLTEQGNKSKSKDIHLQKKIDSLGKDLNFNRIELLEELNPEKIRKLTVACILDEFSYNSFKFESNFVQLSVDSFIEELESSNPDMLFVESAWRGKDDRWGSKVGHASSELVEILQWCKNKNVPTIFWNKEDPVHFNSFLNVAKLFEYVFTTDFDCIHRYKMALNHNRVYYLPFAFQPKLSNPIEKYDRKSGVCFAGAYYHKYPERCKDLSEILSAISEFGDLDIYDRNFGKEIEEFMFPEEFHEYIIGTLPFEEIDVAYKGYQYGLNLNSIKQSQSMFARRIFELIGCNTFVISNYSRGLRLLFGDYVISSDNKSEIIVKYNNLNQGNGNLSRVKLASLREVFQNHTYGIRFRYILSKVSDFDSVFDQVPVLMLCSVESLEEFEIAQSIFNRQKYGNKRMIIHNKSGIDFGEMKLDAVKVYDNEFTTAIKDYDDSSLFVSVLKLNNYYGSNYIIDLVNALTFSDSNIITKSSFYAKKEGKIVAKNLDSIYSYVDSFNPFCSLINKNLLFEQSLLDITETGFNNPLLESTRIFSIDEYNFSTSNNLTKAEIDLVEAKIELNSGIGYRNLIKMAEEIIPDKIEESINFFSSVKFYEELCDSKNEFVKVDYIDGKTRLTSNLGDGKHTYLYWPELMTPDELGFSEGVGKFYFETSPGLRLMLAVVFTDSNGKKIDSSLALSNSNMTVKLPSEHCMVKIGIRVYSGGTADINTLDMGHRDLSPVKVIGTSNVLILTNHYPSYDDIYRNGFIHSRVREYNRSNLRADIFKLREGEHIHFSEFEGVDVISGSSVALNRLMKSQKYDKILVHFLDEAMWGILKNYVGEIEILVWVHGSEVQPWHRRIFNYDTENELTKAKIDSEKRMKFWVPLLQNIPNNLKFIFVSDYFAKEVMEDTGVSIPEEKYEIIHNPIDIEMFNYVEKEASQRFKILSIRPYASKKYANDLTVNAILELSKSKLFKNLEFLLVGAGKLFESTLEPLRKFDNVKIHEGFLTHSEIADLHKEYGIFMTPTRMDSQGVSRDEAMSSGLVPITNSVTAIPEFVDDSCGVLADGEDYKSMAKGILNLIKNEEKFCQMSINASNRVRNQSSTETIISKEINLIRSKKGGN